MFNQVLLHPMENKVDMYETRMFLLAERFIMCPMIIYLKIKGILTF
jgi:hypothetical protein